MSSTLFAKPLTRALGAFALVDIAFSQARSWLRPAVERAKGEGKWCFSVR